jgi:hypothetical protein
MGMGYGASSGWVAEAKWLESLQLDGWDTIQKYLANHDEETLYIALEYGDEESLAEALVGDLDDEQLTDDKLDKLIKEKIKELVAAWERVCKDFYYKTKLNLELYYHDSNSNGSSYDDINGLVYLVSGVTTVTLPGRKQIDAGNVSHASWVAFF